MSEPTIKIPKTIHHSRQRQQTDLGETIYLLRSDEARAYRVLGTIYNFDDIPHAGDPEEVEAVAVAFADKLVRAYNCHDDLLAALQALLAAVKTVPKMNSKRFDQLGIQVNAAIAKAEEALT